jgi:hypothetical protein
MIDSIMADTLFDRLQITANVDPLEQLQNVMSWYPNKRFYERVSAKSGKRVLTVYPPSADCPVYSHEEWYADDWQSPFLDIDQSVSFFAQFRELQKKAPVVALLSSLQENAEYCQDSEGLKNCYLLFDALQDQDVYYGTRIYRSKSCMDVYWIMDSELLYECVYMFSCYNCRYSFHCSQASDSAFLYDCRNVKHSFMCANLRNAEYCIRNVQYTREDYEAFMAAQDFTDALFVLDLQKEWREMISKAKTPSSILRQCEDVSGNYVQNGTQALRTFESYDIRDAWNIFQCASAKDIVGSFMCNDRVERCFQCCATGIGVSNTRNCAFTWHSADMEYCYLCIGCSDCFGCIGLRNKKYHILNKPYTKEEYEQAKADVVVAMRERSEYDSFFPRAFSPFLHEDTIAADFFGDETVDLFTAGYETERSAFVKSDETVRTCAVTGEQFRIIKQEQSFYESRGIAFPCISPAVRQTRRRQLMDTGFRERQVITSAGEVIVTTFAHPERWNLVTDKEYTETVY